MEEKKKEIFIAVGLGLSPIVATSKANAIGLPLPPTPTSIVRNVPSISSPSYVKRISSKSTKLAYQPDDLVSKV